MSWGPAYVPVTLSFWDGSQVVRITYNGANVDFHPGYIWPLGWWGVSAPEQGSHGIYALRSAGGMGAVEAWARIDDDTAIRGTHYQFINVAAPVGLPASDRYIRFPWAAGEIHTRVYPVQLLNVDEDLRFRVTFVGTAPLGGTVGARGSPVFVWTFPSLSFIPDNYYVTVKQTADQRGVVGFLQPTALFDENQTVTVRAYRQAGSAGAVSVDFHTEDGTGTAGADYDESTGTLEWADGEAGPKNIEVGLNNVNGDKTFRIVLDNPGGGVFLNPSAKAITVTIADVAGAGRFAFEELSLQGEAGTEVFLEVRRIGGKTGEVTVDVDLDNGTALAGTHYTDLSDTLTFPDDDNTPQQVEVALIGDEDFPVSFTGVLSNPGGGATIVADASRATIFVLPTDAPEVSIIQDVLEGGFNPFAQRDEIQDPGAYTRRDILVNILQQEVDGEIGWASGGSLYGGGSDYITPGPTSQATWRQKHAMKVRQILI